MKFQMESQRLHIIDDRVKEYSLLSKGFVPAAMLVVINKKNIVDAVWI